MRGDENYSEKMQKGYALEFFFLKKHALNIFFTACRYEKGTWSECNSQSKVVRVDTLKANSDASCEQSRQITKNCKAVKQGKGKAGKNGPNYDHDNKRKAGGKAFDSKGTSVFYFLFPRRK